MLYKLHPNSRPKSSTSLMTASRRWLDLLDPRPEDIDLGDIEAGLGEARFKRQTTIPISVADHSLRCARIALALEQPLEVVLAMLLHDAAEYAFGDLPGPLKRFIFVEVKPGQMVPIEELELGLLRTIAHALIPDPELSQRVWDLCAEKRGAVKQIDVLALRAEALIYMPGAEDWAAGESVETSSGSVGVPPIDPRAWPAMVAPRGSLGWSRTMAEVSARIHCWPWPNSVDDVDLRALARSNVEETLRFCLLGC
jgi:hypothetical protein